MKRTGGGYKSSQHVEKKVQYGNNSASTNVISPAAVNQMGVSTPFPKEPLLMNKTTQVPLGNKIAGNVGKGEPGTGRTLYGQGGTQAKTPTAKPLPAGRSFDERPNKGRF